MKLRLKILISMLTVMLTLITLVSTTFAWFNINVKANVSFFEFKATAGEGFYMSVDGYNWSSDISAAQLKRAMVAGFDSSKYEILEDGELYSYTVSYDENDEEIRNYSAFPLSDSDMNDILQNIRLLPLTSHDGIDIIDQYSQNVKASGGRYLQFDLYFRTVSNRSIDSFKNAEGKLAPQSGAEDYPAYDNYKYGIYLTANEVLKDEHSTEKVSGTTIVSESADIDLKAAMTTINGSLAKNDTVTVYTSNALRFSANDTSAGTALIYELNDSNNANSDLGSYATDYDGSDTVLSKLYKSSTNAMFTYYNNLRPYAKLTQMVYSDMPSTVRALDTTDSTQQITYVQTPRMSKVTGDNPETVEVEESYWEYIPAVQNKVTFRFWLEGWDADCFDGLSKSIKVNLTFEGIPLM